MILTLVDQGRERIIFCAYNECFILELYFVPTMNVFFYIECYCCVLLIWRTLSLVYHVEIWNSNNNNYAGCFEMKHIFQEKTQGKYEKERKKKARKQENQLLVL